MIIDYRSWFLSLNQEEQEEIPVSVSLFFLFIDLVGDSWLLGRGAEES
tara:strand:+ start:403 stop:546 length:144 start_codon:yes stop_codon:yes gene_type:complete